MENYFRALSDALNKGLPAGEVLLHNYQGEASGFVRLNHNKIRQAGRVRQQTLHLNLINNRRETGMTRFACLWVEQGRAVAPVNVMRFDESIYHILGDRLEWLTREREHILDTDSYEWRSDASARLPGRWSMTTPLACSHVGRVSAA